MVPAVTLIIVDVSQRYLMVTYDSRGELEVHNGTLIIEEMS